MTSPLSPESPKKPKGFLVAGAVLLVASVIAAVLGGQRFGDGVTDTFSRLFISDSDLVARMAVPGTTTAKLEPGDYLIVAMGPKLLTRTRDADGNTDLEPKPFPEPNVTVSGPGGDVAVGRGPNTMYSSSGMDKVVIGQIHVERGGTHSFTTTGEGSEVTEVGIAPKRKIDEAVSRTIFGGIVLGFAAMAFLASLIMLIVGGVQRSRASRPPANPTWAGPPPGQWQRYGSPADHRPPPPDDYPPPPPPYS